MNINTKIDGKYHLGYIDIILYTLAVVFVIIEIHMIYKVLT